MKKYEVMGSIYRDALQERFDILNKALDRPCYTQIYSIQCESIEEIPDRFLDEHDEDLRNLPGHVYLWIKDGNEWKRITD